MTLPEIELAVQQRAKSVDLDMGTETGRTALRALIDDELHRLDDDVRRGTRTEPLANTPLLADRAWRNLALYGPLTELLADPDVWEIELNAPGEIFVKRHRGMSGYHHEGFHDNDHVTRTLTKLLDDSSSSHRKLDPTEGLQDAQLDDGSRLHTGIPRKAAVRFWGFRDLPGQGCKGFPAKSATPKSLSTGRKLQGAIRSPLSLHAVLDRVEGPERRCEAL